MDFFLNALTAVTNSEQTLPRERLDIENPTTAHPQSKSSLISKLPYDIRRIIYDELLSGLGGLLHINIHPNNITINPPVKGHYARFQKMHRKCQPCLCNDLSQHDQENMYEECCTGFWLSSHKNCHVASNYPIFSDDYSGWDIARSRGSQLIHDMLLSCRIIYMEFSQLLFVTTTFDLMGLHSAQYFLKITPRLHLDLIQSFQMEWILYLPLYQSRELIVRPNQTFNHWANRFIDIQTDEEVFTKTRQEEKVWEETCQHLYDMKSLSQLTISVSEMASQARGIFPISEKEFLRPLMRFQDRHSRVKIDILLPWLSEKAFKPNEGVVPFNITRACLSGIGLLCGVGGVTYEEPSPCTSRIRGLKHGIGLR